MLTKEQTELRRTRIGSSEVAALLSLDPYKTAFEVWQSKVLPPTDNAKPHQTWGLDLEPAILAHHVRSKGYELLPPIGSLAHPTLPLVCTPDALAKAKSVVLDLQAKNDQGHGQIEWGEPGTDDAPLIYVAQVTVELGVLRATGHDVSHGEIVVSLRGAPPVAYRVDFDAELFGQIAEVCAKWKRDHLDTLNPPDGNPLEVAEYVKRRWAKHGETMLQPTPELVALAREVARLRKEKKVLEEVTLPEVESALKAAIGDAAGIAGVCTWKLQKGSEYTVKREPARVLRLLGAKEQ